MSKTLRLTLKKKWFDLILSGEKKEEYREVKPYWIRRLIEVDYPEEQKGENRIVADNILFDIENGHEPTEVIKSYYSKLREFDTTIFTNGYAKNSPSFDIGCKGIRIGTGRPEWGAEPNKPYFIISLGDIIRK